MHTISEHIVEFLSNNSSVYIERKDWCIYALEKKLYKILCFFSTLLIGYCIQTLTECVLIFFTINFLRSKISGWHTQYSALCVILTVGICCIGGAASVWTAYALPFLFFVLVPTNACLCVFFSQNDNVKLHLTREEMAQNKKLGMYRIGAIMVISAVIFFFIPLKSWAIALQLGLLLALASTYIKE